MYYVKHSWKEEFWGAPAELVEYELFEDYEGEVKDIILQMLEEDPSLDFIPPRIEVEADDLHFEIETDEWLSDEEKDEIYNIIEGVEDGE